MIALLGVGAAILATVAVWAGICGAILWALGRDTRVQLGMGPLLWSRTVHPRLELRLGGLPLGGWVSGEPTTGAVAGVGVAVHLGLALVAAVYLLWVGFPDDTLRWARTVLTFGHPATGGVVRTVLHHQAWIGAHPAATVALVGFGFGALNVVLGSLQLLGRRWPVGTVLGALAPIPWVLWLLWLDLVAPTGG